MTDPKENNMDEIEKVAWDLVQRLMSRNAHWTNKDAQEEIVGVIRSQVKKELGELIEVLKEYAKCDGVLAEKVLQQFKERYGE